MYSSAVRTSVLIFSLLWVFPLASAESTFPDYPVTSAQKCSVSAENKGVTVGLTPVEDSQKQTIYFRAQLKKNGFVPVFIVIENGTGSDALLFDKTKITYGAANSSIPSVHIGPGAKKLVAIDLIPFAGPVVAPQIAAPASIVRQNLMKKEIQSKTLAPGESASGFLYIPIDKNAPRGKIVLQVPISKAGTDETFDLNLTF